jgi:hypothetical protein
MERPSLNPQLLIDLGRLWRTGADASLTVELDDISRVIHVRQGAFVGAETNAPGEELIDLLFNERRLRPADVRGLLATDASALVGAGLLGGDEAGAASARLALLRFERALSMRAKVVQSALKLEHDTLYRPLGPLLVGLFRSRLPPDTASRLVRDLIRSGRTLDVAELRAVIDRLELMPTELKRARALALGGELATLAQSAESAPLVAALMSVTSRIDNAGA